MNSHKITQRIFYEDTDFGGVVYHANHIKLLERCRSDWLWSVGFNFHDLAKQGCIFVVRRIEIDYLKPILFEHQVDVTATITKVGRRSMNFHQTIYEHDKPDQLFCQADLVLVTIDNQMKPVEPPADLIKKMTGDI